MARVGWLARIVGAVGAWIIYRLIWLFGRAQRQADVPWLSGPIGREVIGDAPYREAAEREGLTLERRAERAGLIPRFEMLRGERFDPAAVHPAIRDFYEHTTEFAMDVWSQSYFPMNIGLWLLVTTISRQVDQLDFPLSPLDTAEGMASEIITLRRPDGEVRYTGWLRTLAGQQRFVYAGFYMTERVPLEPAPCVKAVFPMPSGNATVVLRPSVDADGSLRLDTAGARFGGAGFYRVHAPGPDQLRVWKVGTLREQFRVYVDPAGTVRCDHSIRFWGLPVVRLHYKMVRRPPTPAAA